MATKVFATIRLTTMRRPQFALKTLLCWLILIPAGMGALAMSNNAKGDAAMLVLLCTAGAMFGASIGSYWSLPRAAIGAFLGALLAWPAILAFLAALIFLGVIKVE